jgi:hypothetical protein
MVMKLGLELHGILREIDRMHVKSEGHGRVAQLVDAIEWLGHTNMRAASALGLSPFAAAWFGIKVSQP